MKSPEAKVRHNADGLHFVPYQVADFRQLVSDELDRARVDVWYDTKMVEVRCEHELIKHVIVSQSDQLISIEADAFIDCSGDAQVCQFAGISMIRDDTFQAAARVFTLSGMPSIEEHAVQLVLWRAIYKGVQLGEIPSSLLKVYPVPGSMVGDKMSFKYAIPMEVNHLPDNYSQLKKYSEQAIHELILYLQKHTDVFNTLILETISDEVGIRTGLRPKGKTVLTGTQIVKGQKWESGIAKCAWPIEEWCVEDAVKMTYLAEGNYYEIPLECLVTAEISNLFFAGRNISADKEAIASARVMGACLQTGYAAGILASSYCQGTPNSIALQIIQKMQILS